MSESLLQSPDLCIFDVDGTLNGVELWWPDLIRRGLADFARVHGIAIQVPDDTAALAVVGRAGEAVWKPFLPAGQEHRWADLRRLILPMEVELLHSGRDYLYPGIRPLLQALRRQGRRIALASNCPQAYLDAQCAGQGLGPLTDWQYCLDSPGIADKTAMLEAAMAAAGTRRAVMVGDRESDQEAAVAAGIPFIWRRNELCRLEAPAAVWDGDPEALLSLLGLGGISSRGPE